MVLYVAYRNISSANVLVVGTLIAGFSSFFLAWILGWKTLFRRSGMLRRAVLIGSAVVATSSLHVMTPSRAASAPSIRMSLASDHVPSALFVECGFGADQHGQQPTKAAVRACRNAIEFNSLPRMRDLIPGGYEAMRVHVQLGIPAPYCESVDKDQVRAVFPYGQVRIAVEPGGLLADSGIALEAMGDKNSDMIIAVACVTVGYC